MTNQRYITPKGNIFEVIDEYDTHVVIQVITDNNRLEMAHALKNGMAEKIAQDLCVPAFEIGENKE